MRINYKIAQFALKFANIVENRTDGTISAAIIFRNFGDYSPSVQNHRIENPAPPRDNSSMEPAGTNFWPGLSIVKTKVLR